MPCRKALSLSLSLSLTHTHTHTHHTHTHRAGRQPMWRESRSRPRGAQMRVSMISFNCWPVPEMQNAYANKLANKTKSGPRGARMRVSMVSFKRWPIPDRQNLIVNLLGVNLSRCESVQDLGFRVLGTRCRKLFV